MYMLSLCAIVMFCRCSNDKLDIKQDYEFMVEHLPVPNQLRRGETVEIRCRIVKQGSWDRAAYSLRYFQPDGEGYLSDDAGTAFKPNELYDVPGDTFRLYYTSDCEVAQTVDIYFADNLGKTFTLSLSFSNKGQ